MRIVVMGTGGFILPSFELLVASELHEVVAVVTKPQAKTSRRKPPPNPMRVAAEAHGLPVLEPVTINESTAIKAVADFEPELLFVCDYGHILSSDALAVAPLGGINLHASLLPKYRGAAPINWAIYNGDSETGVTVIHMTPRMDAGPNLVQKSVEVTTQDAVELEEQLSNVGGQAVLEAISMLDSWDRESAIGTLQDKAQITKARRLKKEDGAVDWTRSASQIVNQVRAFKPWPATACHLLRESAEPIRLILEEVSVAAETFVAGNADGAAAGEVVLAEKSLHVQTGDGVLSLDRVKPAGKRVMTAEEFLRGNPILPGMRVK